MGFTLGDDGTLDTVLTCDNCGQEFRGTFGGCEDQSHADRVDMCDCYDDFVDGLIEDIAVDHECA